MRSDGSFRFADVSAPGLQERMKAVGKAQSPPSRTASEGAGRRAGVRMKPNPIPPLHVVTDDAVVAREDFLDVARGVPEAGGPRLAFHLRAPRASGRRMHDLATRAADAMMADAGALLVVNDRVDVALAAADGAQVGARGTGAGGRAAAAGAGRPAGRLGSSVDEARAARDGGADFVLAGTIWQTRVASRTASARDRADPRDRRARHPTIAIGGVTPERVARRGTRARRAWRSSAAYGTHRIPPRR